MAAKVGAKGRVAITKAPKTRQSKRKGKDPNTTEHPRGKANSIRKRIIYLSWRTKKIIITQFHTVFGGEKDLIVKDG